MADPDVAIVGGGIAGTATAIALRRRGIDADVYERADEIRPVGAGLSVAPNAMAILDRLGVAGAIEARGVAIDRASFQTAAGRTLIDYDLDGLEPAIRHPLVLIHRAALQEILLDELPVGSLHLGRECTGVEQSPDRVAALLADGGDVSSDVLVAADGIRSAVREDLFPGRTLRPAGQTAYRGIAPVELPASLRRTGREIWGGRVRFGFAPLGRGRVYWYASVSDSPSDGSSRWTKDDLLERYRSFPDPVADLIGRTPADDVIRTAIHDVDPPEALWDRRTVLVGDAAHAATPDLAQGAAQAIEDGFALADRLAAHEDHRAAFRAYQAARLRRVRRIVRDSRRFGRLAHIERAPLATLRDLAIRSAPRSLVRRGLKRRFRPSV